MSEQKRPMSCDEFDDMLDFGNPVRRSEIARRHAAECPRCRALAEALSGVGIEALPASALAKAEAAAVQNLTPVRSMHSALTAANGTMLALVCLFGASVWVLGSRGWAARLSWQIGSSYLGAVSVLVLSLVAAMREREPGLSLVAPWRYAVAALATLVWIGPFVLYEFQPESKFWQHGSLCSCIGLTVGVAAGVLIWLEMRRGYLVSPLRAGWFAGITAGCVAFLVQETYCPVVESGHVALWHGGVVAMLGALGCFTAWRFSRAD